MHISRLHPDDTAAIFVIILKDAIEAALAHATKTPPWYAFSHVCQGWRKIALDCPQLWNNIYFGGMIPYLPVFLARTKNLPLYIHRSTTSSKDVQLIEDI